MSLGPRPKFQPSPALLIFVAVVLLSSDAHAAASSADLFKLTVSFLWDCVKWVYSMSWPICTIAWILGILRFFDEETQPGAKTHIKKVFAATVALACVTIIVETIKAKTGGGTI